MLVHTEINCARHNTLKPSHNGQNVGGVQDFCRRYARQQTKCRSCAASYKRAGEQICKICKYGIYTTRLKSTRCHNLNNLNTVS